MARALAGEEGKRKYRRRAALADPVFGNVKFNRGYDRLSRRGRPAAQSEWRLLAATHYLLRLWRALGGGGIAPEAIARS